MMFKVLILEDNNPLSEEICTMSNKEIKIERSQFAQSKDVLSDYNIIISMACHSETDPFDLSALEIVFLEKYIELPQVKFIFLSWFNFSDHFQYYDKYITPAQSELLDEEKCRFLDVSVSNEEIMKTIKELVKNKKYE